MRGTTIHPAAPGLYEAFGLVVRSSCPLPELRALSDGAMAQIEIVLGDVPTELAHAEARHGFFETAGDTLLIRIGGVARYLLRGGTRIVIAPEAGAEGEDVRAFLLTVVFGALLHQRDELVLHGSAVGIEGRAVVFLGYSGLGKSTLAAGFRRRGRVVLTDDLCVVRPAAEGWSVAPSFPHMKLWLDALAHLELSPDGLRRILHKEEKRALPVRGEFAEKALPLAKCYVLRRAERCAEPVLRPVQGPAKMAALRNQTYRPGMMAALGRQERHFQQAIELARQVPVSLLVRPAQGFHLEALIDLVEAEIANAKG